MNPAMKVLNATLDFVILNTISAQLSPDLYTWLWNSLVIIMAFILRIGIERNNKTLTWSKALTQTIYTISYCFFAVLFWNTYLNYEKGFEIYLFLNALFAVFIVGEGEVVFKIGFKSWLGNCLKSFIATNDKKGEE